MVTPRLITVASQSAAGPLLVTPRWVSDIPAVTTDSRSRCSETTTTTRTAIRPTHCLRLQKVWRPLDETDLQARPGTPNGKGDQSGQERRGHGLHIRNENVPTLRR